jgi:DNA-binding CsgD family transcriptional regulator
VAGVKALLERDEAVSGVRAAVDAARDGTGSLLVVQGPPGTGKTSLLNLAADGGHEAGLAVLAGRGRELERQIGLRVAVDVLSPPVNAADPRERVRLLSGPAAPAAPLFDDSGGAADPAADAMLLGLCWLTANLTGWDLPRTAPRPALLLVDDAQWADAASLRFLAMLADRIDRLPLAMVIAVRHGEDWSDATVARRLVAHRRCRLLSLAPLTAEAVGRLVTAAFPAAEDEFTAAVAHASGGNPFLVDELLRSLRADGVTPVAGVVADLMPDTVLHSVLARLARLPAAAGRLATAVAVLGDGTPLRRAAAHARMDLEAAERAADTLASAHLLQPGNPLSFVHPLIGAAVHADQPAFARSREHRRAADLLAAEGEGVEKVAGHLLASEPEGDPGVVDVLRQAAGRALRRGDPGAAARLLTRAVAEPPPSRLRGQILVELARAQMLAGDMTAHATLTDGLKLLDDDTPQVRVRALTLLAGIRHGSGDRAGAAAAREEALGLLDPDDPRRQDGLAEYLAIVTFDPQLRRNADKWLRPLLDGARRGRAPDRSGLLAHAALGLALAGDPPSQVRWLADKALAADASPNLADHGALLGLALHALVIAGELTAADTAADTAMVTARRRGDALGYAYASYHRALSRFHQGALTEALADLEAARITHTDGWTLAGGWIGWLLARVLMEYGDNVAAEEALRMADDQPADAMETGLLLHVRAQLALAAGEPATALETARAAGGHLQRLYDIDHPGLLPWRTTAALAAHHLGDREQARRLAEEALERARAVGVARDIGVALRVAGLVAYPGPDIGLLTEAATTLQHLSETLEKTRTLIDLGAALRRTGQRTACSQPLQQGLALADRMRARPLAERARAELRAIGLRPRRSAVTGIDALTPSERRAALLAVHGQTNRQIAQNLFITTKTVETHLARTYRKLGISNRRQLRDAFAVRPQD